MFGEGKGAKRLGKKGKIAGNLSFLVCELTFSEKRPKLFFRIFRKKMHKMMYYTNIFRIMAKIAEPVKNFPRWSGMGKNKLKLT